MTSRVDAVDRIAADSMSNGLKWISLAVKLRDDSRGNHAWRGRIRCGLDDAAARRLGMSFDLRLWSFRAVLRADAAPAARGQ